MKFTALAGGLMIMLASGCATRGPRSILPPPLITYDGQGRILRQVQYNSDHSVNTVKAYQYPDGGVTLETVTVYDSTNGWTVTETYNMTDSAVGLKNVKQYDAGGNLLSDRNALVNPGSRSVRINNSP